MAHHNFEMRDELEAIQKMMGVEEPLGATGKYPDGHYGPRDEGEIRFAIAADPERQRVLIDFGKPVHSLGMTPDQAVELADMIHKKAWECRGIK
jgi:hypothetical protein